MTRGVGEYENLFTAATESALLAVTDILFDPHRTDGYVTIDYTTRIYYGLVKA